MRRSASPVDREPSTVHDLRRKVARMSPFTPDARRQSSAHPVAIRALLAAALLATAATFFLATFVALPRTSTFFHVIYPGLYLIPAGACLARGAMVRSERRAWLL